MSLEFSAQEESAKTLLSVRDFPRTVFLTETKADEPTAFPQQALNAAQEAVAERERRYAEPLGDPDRPGNAEFRVLALVERVLLAQPLRVPGVQMLPLRSGDDAVGNRSTDEAAIINGALGELEWRVWLKPDQWAQLNTRERPIMVMHMRWLTCRQG